MSGIIGGAGSRSGVIGVISQNIALSLGKGIDFGATANTGATNASTTSELLDDYEEGTWTPVATGTAQETLLVALGKYIKIGSMVTAFATITFDSINLGTGKTKIGGLPYTSSGSSTTWGCQIGECSINVSDMSCYLASSVDHFYFLKNTGASGPNVDVTQGDTASKMVSFQINYYVTF